jgi:hypothetical protein
MYIYNTFIICIHTDIYVHIFIYVHEYTHIYAHRYRYVDTWVQVNSTQYLLKNKRKESISNSCSGINITLIPKP